MYACTLNVLFIKNKESYSKKKLFYDNLLFSNIKVYSLFFNYW